MIRLSKFNHWCEDSAGRGEEGLRLERFQEDEAVHQSSHDGKLPGIRPGRRKCRCHQMYTTRVAKSRIAIRKRGSPWLNCPDASGYETSRIGRDREFGIPGREHPRGAFDAARSRADDRELPALRERRFCGLRHQRESISVVPLSNSLGSSSWHDGNRARRRRDLRGPNMVLLQT